MLKPFYIKKKNIDDRLVPDVSAADAGKVLGVNDDGKVVAVEAGGGFSIALIDLSAQDIVKVYQGNTVSKSTQADTSVAIVILRIPDGTMTYCYLSVASSTDLVYRSIADTDINIKVEYKIATGIANISQRTIV